MSDMTPEERAQRGVWDRRQDQGGKIVSGIDHDIVKTTGEYARQAGYNKGLLEGIPFRLLAIKHQVLTARKADRDEVLERELDTLAEEIGLWVDQGESR